MSLAVRGNDGWAIGAGGAKVEQHRAATAALKAVVGKIGVGLHQVKLKQLAEQQADQQRSDPVPLCLRCVLQRLNGYALHIVHGQHVVGGPVGVHCRHAQRGIAVQQVAKLLLAAGLAQVVGFFVQLLLGFV